MLRSRFLLALLVCGVSFFAKAETVYIQTAAGETSLFPDGSRVVVAGINDFPVLTLNGPVVDSELYDITLQPTSGSKSSGSELLTDSIAVIEDPESGPNALASPFTISQTITETASGTFAALAGATFVIPLTTGHYLIITPLANADLNTSGLVDADFQLTSTLPTPEPSSILLVGIGLAGLVAIGRKLRFS